MKIQILSDTHFDVDEVRDELKLVAGVDVVVVAGDVGEGARESFEWLRQRFGSSVPIVTVAGNHTFYRRCIKEEIEIANEIATDLGIHFLEDRSVQIEGITFSGCTLWTDYCLMGGPFRPVAMREAGAKMMDHKCITWQKEPWQRFRPLEAAALNYSSLDFIRKATSKLERSRHVVVTHHAPSIKSVASIFRDAILSAAYASDLEQFIVATGPALWIHGHTHNSSDYKISDTRVICNPHGYGNENSNFNPKMTVEL
jgi:Icc-related predicted phosphoesterase